MNIFGYEGEARALCPTHFLLCPILFVFLTLGIIYDGVKVSLRLYLSIIVFLVSCLPHLDDSVLRDVVLVDVSVSPGLPDSHGQLGSLVSQLVVYVNIVLCEVLLGVRVLACPHALRDDVPGGPLLPACQPDDVGMVLLLFPHWMAGNNITLVNNNTCD